MTNTMGLVGEFELRSSLPGRARWYVASLRDQPSRARALQRALAEVEFIRTVNPNPLTATVLIQFDPAITLETIAALLQMQLQPEASAPTPSSPAQAAEPERPTTSTPRWRPKPRQVVIATACVGVFAAVGSAGTLAFGAIVASSWLVARDLRERLAKHGSSPERLRSLEQLVHPHRGTLLRALACQLGSGAFGILRFVFVGMTINVAFHGTGLRLGALALRPATTAMLGVGGALASIGLRAWLRRRSRVLWGEVTSDVQHRLRMDVHDHVQAFELEQVQRVSRQDLQRVLSSDINELELLADGTWNILDLMSYATLMIAGIVVFSPSAVALAVMPLPIIAGLTLILSPKAHAAFIDLHRKAGKLAFEVREELEGFETVRVFGAEADQRRRVERRSQEYREASRGTTMARNGAPMLLEAVVFATTSITYATGSQIAAANALAFGHVVTLNQLIAHTVFTLARLGGHLDSVERGAVAVERILEVLGRERTLEPEPASIVPAGAGEIVFRDVRFSYPKKPCALAGVSLRCAAGQTTAIVGVTGAGKSTLLKLLLRLYEPQSGTIEIDGRTLAQLPRHAIHRQIAVVNQDVFLFERSIADNIRLGCPHASDEQVAEVARIAQADGFIRALPHGYQTIIGRNGETLSGGERQRVAIARALLLEARIVVFDEATSQLDSDTEVALWAALRPRLAGRTVVAITHRLAVARSADHICVLDRGVVSDAGTHDELLARPGRYQDLWMSQFGSGDD